MMDSSAQIKFGIISEVLPASGFARVEFQDDNIVSHALQIIAQTVGENRVLILPAVGEFVACLMDANLENGVILGGCYTEANPPEFGANRGFKFGDSEILFNTSNNEITIKSSAKIIIDAGAKIEIKNPTESLGGVLSDLITAIQAITHNVTAVGSPTGPPINLAEFQALAVRLGQFLD